MIKIVVLICRLMAPQPCTEDTAIAAVMADRQDDGTPCQAMGRLLMKEVHANLQANDFLHVACQKDGQPFH